MKTLMVMMLGAGLVVGGCGGKGSGEQLPEPVAQVWVAVAKADSLTETLSTFGSVIPAPGSAQSFAVPFECVVQRVLVSAGQRVTQGQALVRVVPSPEVQLAANQARAALVAQQTVTGDTRRRFELGLATRDEGAQADEALANAQAQVQKFDQWTTQGQLLSPASGLVREVMVNEGAVVPAGNPIVSVALQHRFEVQLGVEPEDIFMLQTGQPVRLRAVDRSGGADIVGRIRSIGQQVSLDTRLVEVLVALPDKTDGMLLNQFVHADIEIRGTRGLIVPRSAVLPQEDRFWLFTVHDGRALQHTVVLGVETDSLVQVNGAGLAAGDSVVILGNYELTDSMRVHVLDGSEQGKR
jgi:RND family efflux transporter MFP subunit